MAHGLCVVGALEQVGVDLEGDAGFGVPELAADEDDVEAVGDQERGSLLPPLLPRARRFYGAATPVMAS